MIWALIVLGALAGMALYAILASSKSENESVKAMARHEVAAVKLAQHLRQQRQKGKGKKQATWMPPDTVQEPPAVVSSEVPPEKLRHRSRLRQRKVDKGGQIS